MKKFTFLMFFVLYIFYCDSSSAQTVGKLKSELKDLNDEINIKIALRDGKVDDQKISIRYSTSTRCVKLEMNNPFLRKNLDMIDESFKTEKDFLVNLNRAIEYQKNSPPPTTPKIGDSAYSIKFALLFIVELENDIIGKYDEPIAFFVVKEKQNWVEDKSKKKKKSGDESEEDVEEIKPPKIAKSYQVFSIQGSSLEVVRKANTKFAEFLNNVRSNIGSDAYVELKPNVIINDYGLALASDSAKIDGFRNKFNNSPSLGSLEGALGDLSTGIIVAPPKNKDRNTQIVIQENNSDVLKNVEPNSSISVSIEVKNRRNYNLKVTKFEWKSNNGSFSADKGQFDNKEIKPGDAVKGFVSYYQSKGNTIDQAEAIVTIDDTINYSLKMVGMTRDKAPFLFVDLEPFYLTGRFWLPSFNGNSGEYNWNFTIKPGNTEIGYPLWSSGNWNLLAGYKDIVKVGITFPGGSILNKDFGPISPPKRNLIGTWGITSEINFQALTVQDLNSPFTLGGYFYYGNIKNYSESPKGLKDMYYFVPIVAQVYYPIIFADDYNNPKHVYQFKVGFSYHQVKSAKIIQPSEVGAYLIDRPITKDDIGKSINWEVIKKIPSPYVKLDYLNKNSGNDFGFGFQYVNNIISLSGWIEFGKMFKLEAQYIQPLRTVEAWENGSFIWLTPRFSFPLTF